MLPSRPLPATYGNKSQESDPARVYEGELLEARGPGLHRGRASKWRYDRGSGTSLGRRLSSTHSRSQSRRHETRHAFPVTTTVSKAPGIITDRARSPDENAYKKCRRLPPITLRHPIRLLSTLGQTQLTKVPLKHGDDAGGPGRSHRNLSFGYPPLLEGARGGRGQCGIERVLYSGHRHLRT